jgi:hypothetical protein
MTTDSPTPTRAWSGKTFGVLAVVGLVIAFSLSSTLVKLAEALTSITYIAWSLWLIATGIALLPLACASRRARRTERNEGNLSVPIRASSERAGRVRLARG